MQDGSEVSAAEVVTLARTDSACTSKGQDAHEAFLPAHQYSPAHLVVSRDFDSFLTSRSETQQGVAAVLQQLEGYRVSSGFCNVCHELMFGLTVRSSGAFAIASGS